MNNNVEISYKFSDIALKPAKNICSSRLLVDIESEIIRGITRPIPIIGANMSSVTNASFINKLYELGAFGILHRAWRNHKLYLDEVRKIAANCNLVAASVGIDDNAIDMCKNLIKVGCNIICIDVANAYCDWAINLAKKIRQEFRDIKIIIGNTTNIDFFYEVVDIVDAIKIGIGSNSSVCTTYDVTGFTEGQFSAVLKFKELSQKHGMPIISDGGCRKSSDFCKAIAAGANSVMLGTVLVKCPESASTTIESEPNVYKKLYSGMSSENVQKEWRGQIKSGTCAEGKTIYLDLGESVDMIVDKYASALRSSITYGGGKDIKSFQDNVKFVRLL